MNETPTPDDETSSEDETPKRGRTRRTTPRASSGRRTGALTRKTPVATPKPKAVAAKEPEEEKTTAEPEMVDVDLDGDVKEEKKPTRRRRRPAAKKAEVTPEEETAADESESDEEPKRPARRRRRRPAAMKVDEAAATPEEERADESESDEEPKRPVRRRRRSPARKVDETAARPEEERADEAPVGRRRTPARTTTPLDDDDAAELTRPRRSAQPERRPFPVKGAPAKREADAEPKGRAMGPDARQGNDRPRRGQERSAVRGERQTGGRELKPFVEKGFELVHLPDGTLVRSEMSKKNRHGDGGRRRPRYGDEGPGPALPGFDEINYEPVAQPAPPARRAPAGGKGIVLGDLTSRCRRSVNFLKRRLPLVPRVAVILGSGLSGVADLSNSDEVIDFVDIPDFPTPSAPGHEGIIRVGAVEGTPTLFCEGRVHYYENGSMADTVYPIQTLLAMGIEHFILTTSVGALNPSYRVGDLMFIEDQINLTGDNPFFGVGGHDGPSFVDTTRIYDDEVLGMSDRLCRRARVKGHHGVLAVTRGPVYETPAERKMLAGFGADAVSMSVAPEAMVLARAGATVVGIAVVVNEASSAARRPVSHNEVLAAGQRGAMGLARLVTAIIGQGW